APTSIFGTEATFSYEASAPTTPGTSLTNVQTSLPLIFPLIAVRDLTGAWQFDLITSPTFYINWLAKTDLLFPNSPGVYQDLPSLVTAHSPFGTTMAAGTVD